MGDSVFVTDGQAALTFLAMLAIAVFLLWRFSHVRWYWHALAVAGALVVGFMPPLRGNATAIYDLTIGAAFLFLFIWGAGEPLYKGLHLPRHR